MKRGSIILASLLAVALIGSFFSGMLVASAQTPIVRFYFFYSKECADCQIIKNEFLSTLSTQYGDQIEINYLDVSEQDILEQRLILEQRHGVLPPPLDTPEIYIANEMLVGADEIRARLPELIDKYLAEGGLALVQLPPPPIDDPDTPVVRFFFFHSTTCPHCHDMIENYLPTIYEKYGDQVQARYLETHQGENGNYFNGLLLKLDVPPEKQGYVPTLVIGDKVLVGGDITEQLEGLIEEYLAQGGVDYPSVKNLPQPVELLIFFDSTDAGMIEKLQSIFAPLSQQYASWIRVNFHDLSQSEGIAAQKDYNAALGVPNPPAGTPQVLIDRHMLVGLDEIENQLPELVEKYKVQGGIKLPSLEELEGESSSNPPTPVKQPTAAVQKTIYVAYFDQDGCQECARTSNDLVQIQEKYSQLEVETFAIEENKALNEWLGQKFAVPEKLRLTTPMVFIGSDVFIGSEANLSNMMLAVAKYTSTGAERTWDDFDEAEAQESLLDRFKSFGMLTVLGAGLVDGLNPCAFATLVFFISYLTFTGRRGREILFVGLSFTLGVFLTYLLVGVGLLKAVQSLPFFTSLGRWVYLVTALLCMLLAVLTFRDFFRARKGQTSEMALKLPKSLQKRIHKVIRENAQVRAFVAVAFFTGFVVSLLELACTGQVYLPTIMFVLSVPELAAQAFLYLLLYCLMFIAPLVVVFALSYFGTTSEQLGRFVNRHTTTVKLFTGLVFVGLAQWMTWTLLPLFDLASPWNWASLVLVIVTIILGVAILQYFEKPLPPNKKSQSRARTARKRKR